MVGCGTSLVNRCSVNNPYQLAGAIYTDARSPSWSRLFHGAGGGLHMM